MLIMEWNHGIVWQTDLTDKANFLGFMATLREQNECFLIARVQFSHAK